MGMDASGYTTPDGKFFVLIEEAASHMQFLILRDEIYREFRDSELASKMAAWLLDRYEIEPMESGENQDH